jgi:pimeloyl-ACP methyl ester carboxylesterase
MAGFPIAGYQTVVVNGATLAYLERGQGQSVVFVHGGYSDLRTWLPQLDPFAAAGYRALAYSRRYARPNEDIPQGQDDQLGPHVNDLLSLLRGLQLAPAHLVGNSWGAFICLLAALREPDLVRTLVLGEPPVLPLFISNTPRAGELVRLFLRSPSDAIAIINSQRGLLGQRSKPTGVGTWRAGPESSCPACLALERTRPCPRNASSRCARTTPPIAPSSWGRASRR